MGRENGVPFLFCDLPKTITYERGEREGNKKQIITSSVDSRGSPRTFCRPFRSCSTSPSGFQVQEKTRLRAQTVDTPTNRKWTSSIYAQSCSMLTWMTSWTQFLGLQSVSEDSSFATTKKDGKTGVGMEILAMATSGKELRQRTPASPTIKRAKSKEQRVVK